MTSPSYVTTQSTRRGLALIATAMFFFACIDGLSKYLMQPGKEDFSVIQVLWIRYLFLVVLCVIFSSRHGGIAMLRTRRPWLQVARSVIFLVQLALVLLGFKFLPMDEVVSIGAAAPLLVTAASVPLLGEKVGVRRWTAVSVGFVGVLLILRPGLAVVQPASLWVLLATGLFTIVQVMTRVLARTDSSETTVAYTALIGAAALSTIGPFYWTPPDTTAWILLIVIATFGGLGNFLFIIAVQTAPPVALQPLYYTLLVWSTLMGYVLFGDIPDAFTIIGASMIVGGGLYALFRERRL